MLSKEELKDRVIRIIAATRFPFVDQTDWGEDYVTITNEGGKKIRGISGPMGYVYPSIVITKGNTDIQEIGEVETEDTVTEVQVPKWRHGQEGEEVIPICPRRKRGDCVEAA
jgi:hypothetical protein